MKKMILILSMLFLFSCAHTENKKMNNSLVKYDAKNHVQIQYDVQKLLDNHPELDSKTKEKVKRIIMTSLDENKKLKARESQLAQHFIHMTLVEKANYREVVKLRRQMIDNYKKKIKVFEKAAVDLKHAVGIEKPNSEFLTESERFFQ